MDKDALVDIIIREVVKVLMAKGYQILPSQFDQSIPDQKVISTAYPMPSPCDRPCPGSSPAEGTLIKGPAFDTQPCLPPPSSVLPTIMVCFCGNTAGNIEEIVKKLQGIRENTNMHLFFSATFQQSANVDSIKAALNPIRVCCEVNSKRLREMIPHYKALVVPTMSINTLAKLNAGITDSVPTTVIFESLAKGLPTFICREGVDPELLTISTQLTRPTPASLRSTLYNYITHLEQWGVQFIELGEMPQTIEGILLPAREVLKKKKDAAKRTGRLIITREDIEEFLKDGLRQLTLPPGAIVTPVAREYAQERGFRLDDSSTTT